MPEKVYNERESSVGGFCLLYLARGLVGTKLEVHHTISSEHIGDRIEVLCVIEVPEEATKGH